MQCHHVEKRSILLVVILCNVLKEFKCCSKMKIDEPATTFYKGEKVRSYKISFKLQVIVIEYAKNRSITAAAQKYKVDRHSIRDWKKKKNKLQEISSTKNSNKRIRLEGGGRKPLRNEMEETLL